ncbi:4062_t:CDS:2, partial [Funneliformis caledonium]
KWVDPRTFERHQRKIDRFHAITSESQDFSQLKSIKNKPVDNIEEDFDVMIDKDSTEDDG